MTAIRSVTASLSLAVLSACGAADPDHEASSAAQEDRVAVAGLGAQELQTTTPFRVPRATGEFAVSVRRTYVEDATRPDPQTQRARALPTWVYSPALITRSAPRATYLSPAVREHLEGRLALPPGLLDVPIDVVEGARATRRFRGVLLASGGWGTPVAFNTALITELVSHGWVVVAFDHPYDTFAVEQPDGTLVEGLKVAGDEAFAARVSDIAVVLENLPSLVPGSDADTPVGMWGHSLGGAAALEALRIHARLLAAVDLDGTPRGQVVELGTDKPVGTLSSNAFIEATGQPDPLLATLVSHLTGPYSGKDMLDIAHYGFTDFALFSPQAGSRDAVLAAALENAFETDATSIAEGRRVIAEQRRFLSHFMARFVR